jgi:ABC-type phosphate/phosphonate transport system substrate-binding protein
MKLQNHVRKMSLWCLAWLSVVAVSCVALSSSAAAADGPQLTLVVMDPLAAPLACACVEGYAQRRYGRLGEYLEDELNCPVRVVFGESLQSVVNEQTGGQADLIIGKDSVVRHDARQLKRTLRPLAALTGTDGSTAQHGLFVVPCGDPAKTLSDLKGYRILFGPLESEEKHAAAVAALTKAGVPAPAVDKREIREACSEGACDVLEAGVGAAVISNYAKPLLEGCGTIERGALKVVGRTADVPFVTAFASDSLDDTTAQRIRDALLAVGKNEKLCAALETRRGFVAAPDEKKK